MSGEREYTFGETDTLVTGGRFNLTEMRRGLVVGGLIRVKFNRFAGKLPEGGERFELEFAQVTDGEVTGVLGLETMEFLKRYKFFLPPPQSLSFAIYARTHQRHGHQKTLEFQLACSAGIIRTKDS